MKKAPNRSDWWPSTKQMAFIFGENVDALMAAVRPPADALGKRAGFLPYHLAAEEITKVAKSDHYPIGNAEQDPVLEPSRVWLDECPPASPILHVGRIRGVQAGSILAEGAVGMIGFSPVNGSIVSIANVEPERPLRLQAAHDLG